MNQRMEKLIGLRKVAEDGTSPYGKFDAMFKDTKLEQLYKIFSDEFISAGYIDDQKVRALGYYIGLFGGTESNLYKFCIADHPNIFGNLKSIEELVNTNDAGYSDFKPNFEAGVAKREEIASSPVSDKIHERYKRISKYIQDNPTRDSVTLKKYVDTYFSDQEILRDMSSSIERDIFIKQFSNSPLLRNTKGELYKEIDAKSAPTSPSSAGSKKTNNKPSDSSRPQATTGEILIDEAHRGLTGLVDGNDPKFVYTTDQNGSWADYTYDGKPGSRRLDNTFKNWPEVVRQINTFPIGKATKTAPAATTPTTPTTAPTGADAAKAPVPEGEAAGVQTRRVVSDAVVMNVAKVLTDVYGGATYAGRTVFRNEMGMVRKMMDQLNSTAESLGVTIGSAEALAQIITPSIRPGLGRFGTANLDGLGERDMEKQYRTELNLIMTAVKNLFDRIKKSPAQLLNYQPNFRAAYEAKNAGKAGAKAPVAGTTPAATPAPSAPATPAPSAAAAPASTAGGTPAPKAEAEANDGSSFGKKSSQSSKFKKLAKLRRLRVRGQMEAATEPSARLGVSRIS